MLGRGKGRKGEGARRICCAVFTSTINAVTEQWVWYTLDPVRLCALPPPASSAATIAKMVLVFPVPGGPCRSVTVAFEEEAGAAGTLFIVPSAAAVDDREPGVVRHTA